MRQSESGRPLLRNGHSGVKEKDYDIDMADMGKARSVADGNRLSHLDASMQATLRLEFDNRCFLDGERQIDYVLAYEEEDESSQGSSEDPDDAQPPDGPHDAELPVDKKARRRYYFQWHLKEMGLELEERSTDPSIGRTKYVLIHAPFSILEKQAQLLNVKLPVKQCDPLNKDRKILPGIVDRFLNRIEFLDFDNRTKMILEEPDYYTAPYTTDRRQQFVNHDKHDILFPSSERSRMVYDLLVRAHYNSPYTQVRNVGDWAEHHVGIERLLANYTYTGAFPLHQELRDRTEMDPNNMTQREMLYTCWASWRTFFKYQPLDLIKRYFGSKIGLYFAWLGYYTKTLYPAAIIGLIAVLVGMFVVGHDVTVNDICFGDIGRSTLMCPYCQDFCPYQPLNSSCSAARLASYSDNTFTVIFAAIMSVWASLFLEGWKRYHSEVAWKWGLLDFAVEEDAVRPEFQYRAGSRKYNPVTKSYEPYLSTKKRILNFFGSGATVTFFILLVLAVVFGMTVYRVILLKLISQDLLGSGWLKTNAFYVVTISAGLINLVVILIMNYVYYLLALALTRWECPRTQNDFDNSFTIKVFLFQFVNYYASLFYIAFFKPFFTQLPACPTNEPGGCDGYFGIFGFTRLEGCDAAGCFAELVIQLAIIMCGRQFFSSFMEIGYPLIMTLIRKWQYLIPESKTMKAKRKMRESMTAAKKTLTSRWEKDYFLSPIYDQFLFDEYLEMVIQFGFITLFVAAFPLAPLFALINNIIEIRLDAFKFLVTMQRPMPAQSRNIGIWLDILDLVSKISVPINALVIAFTSDFIPKTFYYYKTSFYKFNQSTMTDYVDWSMSYFDAHVIDNTTTHIACRFRGFRKPPCSLMGYLNITDMDLCDKEGLMHTNDWWQILVFRLVFVVVFEHVVFLIKSIVDYVIPDVPTKIFIQQQREKYLARKELISNIEENTDSITDKRAVTADMEQHAFQPGNFDRQHPRATLVRPESLDLSFKTCRGDSASLQSYDPGFEAESIPLEKRTP